MEGIHFKNMKNLKITHYDGIVEILEEMDQAQSNLELELLDSLVIDFTQ